MNVQTIAMDQKEAQAMVDLYRAEIRNANNKDSRKATAIDRMLLRGYKRLAAGQRLIDVIEVMRRVDLYDAQCRPRLAFCRATATTCEWKRTNESAGEFHDRPRVKGKRATHPFPSGTFRTFRELGRERQSMNYWSRHKARVPMIPLHLRPADSLSNYFLLFEAEWEHIPPKDPMLLKQLHDNLYVVVAEWDLTELERAVLQGMMRKEST